MKKSILTIFFTIITILGYSQNKIGVFVGANHAGISNGILKSGIPEGTIAFHIGGLFEMKLNNKVSFRPKLMYSQQGDRSIDKSLTSSNNQLTFVNGSRIDYKLSYLNLPLTFKFFNKTYILMGPQLGILLSTEKLNLDFGNIENTLDFGINLGFGQEIKEFFIELNLYQGISTLIKYENLYASDFNGTNNVIQLSVGYYF